MSSSQFDQHRRGGPLVWTFAVAAVTGLLSLGAVDYLARHVARPVRLAKSVNGSVADPEVTGSIAPTGQPSVIKGARSVVLDPCTGRERLLVRGP